LKQEEFIGKLCKEGLLPQGERPHWSKEEQESLYTSAYSLYQTGKFSDAAALFTQLILCDPFVERSWRGLASAQQMDRKYKEALHAWALVALMTSDDPAPHLHAAECLLAIGEKIEALKALNEVEKRLSNDVTSQTLRGKIELLRRAM